MILGTWPAYDNNISNIKQPQVTTGQPDKTMYRKISLMKVVWCNAKYCHRCYAIDLWQIKSHCGRCCNYFIGWLADVIAKVADGIATLGDGRCYYHCGR